MILARKLDPRRRASASQPMKIFHLYLVRHKGVY
jgi:hypothetical protein